VTTGDVAAKHALSVYAPLCYKGHCPYGRARFFPRVRNH
jgi:hypothetical protein